MSSLNPHLFVIALLTNLLLVRLSGFFLPDQYYFSFSAFLFDTRDIAKPVAILAKLLVPFVASFALVAVMMWIRRAQAGLMGKHSLLAKVLDDQAPLTLAYAAFATALLMAWPYILLWDVLIAPELSQQRLPFLLAYFAYFFANAYFALAGANTARLVLTPADPDRPFTLGTLAENRITKPIFDLIAGAASTAMAALIASQAG